MIATPQDALETIAAFLNDTEPYWKEIPFAETRLSWETNDIAEKLDSLPSEEALDAWLTDGPLSPIAHRARELSQIQEFPTVTPRLPPTPRVPGRKRLQIERFISCLLPCLQNSHAKRIVDWCSGKSHLGRLLAETLKKPLLAIELQAQLCKDGLKECALRELQAEFICTDVLKKPPELQPDDFAVALHACGELHIAFIETALRHRIAGLAFSPCCYNRPTRLKLEPLSQHGRQSPIQVTPSDLDLIHREPSVASERDRRKSERDRIWRLGFDLWQRAAQQTDHYRPMPPFPRQWLQLSFRDFCYHFAELDNANPQSWPDPTPFEALGEQRFLQVTKRERIRALFRRPLELWLFFDRVAWLQEAGYHVQWGVFCAPSQTPRNLLCIAQRDA